MAPPWGVGGESEHIVRQGEDVPSILRIDSSDSVLEKAQNQGENESGVFWEEYALLPLYFLLDEMGSLSVGEEKPSLSPDGE